MSPRIFMVAVLGLCVFAGAPVTGASDSAAGTKSVERARYSVQDHKTRVVLDVSGRCGYKITTHKNPDRIAVNIPDTRAGKLLKALELNRGVVERIRVNRLSWGTQVVLDLGKPVKWRDFSLGKNGDLPDRIVVDVFDSPATTRSYKPGAGINTAARAPTPGVATGGDRPFTVAIDPGHGGKDPGATGRNGLVEKKIVLDISKRIAQRINGLRGYKAVLTRNRDVYLPLERRVEIAAAKDADAFVSIHLNSARNRSARGVEIFFISPGGARITASNVLSNPDRVASELGLSSSKNTDLLHMLVDVNQQSVMMRSEFLAEAILESMSKKGLPPTRTVKQKSFSVLRTIEMPSVLVEAGFLSNNNDAKLVRGKAGRQQVADAIANGIVSYFSNHPPPRGERKPAAFVHKVRKGESLWRISRRYGTTIASIRRANDLNNSSVLWVGQELIINRY